MAKANQSNQEGSAGKRSPMKRCCYCGRLIKESAKACAAHRDLPALDKEQTGWVAK